MKRHTQPTPAPQSAPPNLWRQFTGAARKTKDFILWEAVFPTTKRSLAAFLLWSQVGAPLAMLAFPTAEDVLRDAGLDPALAQQMGADHVRVLPATFTGTFLHRSMIRTPGLALLSAATSNSTPQELQGAATQGYFNVTGKLFGFCALVLPTMENYDVRGMVAGLTGGELRKEDIRADLPYTPLQSFAGTALHELRHCTQDLPTTIFGDSTMTESDADAQSLAALGRIFNDAQTPYVKIYARAINLGTDSHDTALYADAALQGRPLPTEEEITTAAQEIDEYLDSWYLRRFGKERSWSTPTRDFAPRALKALLARREASGLSPLALRRAQLYVEGRTFLTGGAPLPSIQP